MNSLSLDELYYIKLCTIPFYYPLKLLRLGFIVISSIDHLINRKNMDYCLRVCHPLSPATATTTKNIKPMSESSKTLRLRCKYIVRRYTALIHTFTLCVSIWYRSGQGQHPLLLSGKCQRQWQLLIILFGCLMFYTLRLMIVSSSLMEIKMVTVWNTVLIWVHENKNTYLQERI